MALTRLIQKGYGQIELNNVAFRRDGRIEAQCKLGDTFNTIPAENGMLLAVNNVKRTVDLPVNGNEELIALNYSAEHLYDERKQGLKDFKLEKGTFYPRMGYLAVADKFTTNTVGYGEEFESVEALQTAVKAGRVNGIPSAEGLIEVTTEDAKISTAKIVLRAVEWTTMPDGQPAIKFQVVKA